MAISPQYQFKVAAGLNNAGSLVNVETLTDGERYFYAPTLMNDYVLRQPGADGLGFSRGYRSFTWQSDLWRGQYGYLYGTLLTGSLSNYVTFQTLEAVNSGAYSVWQGILTLPQMNDMTRNFKMYQNVNWQFTRCLPVT